MNGLEGEALSDLLAVVQSLVPTDAPAGFEPTLAVRALRTTPVGIGGFVGPHRDPVGSVQGLFVDAKLAVTVRAADESQLANSVATTTQSVLGADRAALRAQGVLRLELDSFGSRPANGVSSQELIFLVFFEFLRRPEDGGGVIERIPLGAGLQREILDESFTQDPLSRFDVIDDPEATHPGSSEWSFSEAEQRVEQRSRFRGGSLPLNPRKPGTYLVLRNSEDVPPLSDLDLEVDLESEDRNGLGVVFRFQDEQNFYYFLMNRRNTFRVLGKKVNGDFSFFDNPGVDDGIGFELGQRMRIRVNVQGPQCRVYVDGRLSVFGEDSSIRDPGRVGFMCHGNNRAFFYRLRLVAISS